MVVGALILSLDLPASHSLKDKRRIIRSILERTRNHFSVSAAEVDEQDVWQRATLGFAFVSNSGPHANEVLSKVLDFVEGGHWEIEVLDSELELLHL